MNTRPATTVGLASRLGAGRPATAGGCQCQVTLAAAAFDGVNAVAGLTELCCGPCRYCGQSRLGPVAAAAPAGPATAGEAASTKPASPKIIVRARKPVKGLNLNIAHPPSAVNAPGSA